MAMIETTVETGRLRGTYGGNQAITIFKGVPFAKPPVGDLRWRAPQPADKWEGTFQAIEYNPIPLQRIVPDTNFYKKEFYPENLPQSEDCLYLNVFTPAKTTEEKLPVAFWIYGGGFNQGYAHKMETDGEAFAKRGVIYVSVNYRLNCFGFLAHPELTAEDPHGSSGNYGMLDQIAALQWVRRNIGAFGGDPDRITIFGQSAGAMSVQTLLTSPLTRGAIHGAIMESAGGYGCWTRDSKQTLADAEKIGKMWLDFVGCGTIAEARQIPAEELRDMTLDFLAKNRIELPFRPVIDDYMLTMSQFEAVAANALPDIPIMIGATSNESSSDMIPSVFPSVESFAAQKSVYFGEDYPEFRRINGTDTQDGVVRYCTREFNYRLQSTAIGWCAKRAQMGLRPSYLYCFSRDIPQHEPGGAFHSSEHMYIFQTFLRSWRTYSGADLDLSNIMCAYWTNFIKTGDPNGEGLPRWETYTLEKPEWMILDVDCHMERADRDPSVKFEVEYALKQ